MKILFRSNESALSAGSLQGTNENKPRWNGKFKHEILRKCFLSLQSDLTDDDEIIIINDRTTDTTLNWFKSVAKCSIYVKDVPPIDACPPWAKHPFPDLHPVNINCCLPMMEFLLQICEQNPEEIIYVCEDDYLHIPGALTAMKDTMSRFDGFYLPYDYPDRYTIDRTRNCELVYLPAGHYRTVPSSTLTMATFGKTFLRFKMELLRAGVFADDTWTWKAFKLAGSLCPIPGHATHLQEGLTSPGRDWDAIWNSISG
jgi:glycosyltransferase involved in cell wall biosynthesis